MNEEAIQKIMNYMEEKLCEPESHWSKQNIQEQSYARWAADEILLSIMEQPFVEPDTVVYSFLMKMAYFSYGSENTQANSMFQIAENTAEDILGLIL